MGCGNSKPINKGNSITIQGANNSQVKNLYELFDLKLTDNLALTNWCDATIVLIENFLEQVNKTIKTFEV